MQKFSKNKALLSSVILHAAVLRYVFNHKTNSQPGLDQSSSTILVTLAENRKKAFKKRFYTTNNIKYHITKN